MKTKSLVVAMVAAVLTLGPTARAAGPAVVTLSFGRAQWAPAEKCQPITGAVDLGQVADALAARGLAGNAVVITSYTDETTRKCKGGITRQASWPISKASRTADGPSPTAARTTSRSTR
jgi:hypothetical protein